MAASVRIEDEAFSDRRYDTLARECGLADGDHARGKMAVLWRQCTLESRLVLPTQEVVDVLGPNAVVGLVAARLGDVVDGGIRIRGTKGRIEWLKKLRSNGKFGKRGGRPRRNPDGLSEKPRRVSKNDKEQTPPAPSPAPAPSPSPAPSLTSQTREGGTRAGPDRAAADLAKRIWFDHCDRHAQVKADFGCPQPSLTRTEMAQGWRDLRERIRSFGDDLAAAEGVCRYVLELRHVEARNSKSVDWFGEGLWTEKQFRLARDRKPGGPAVSTRAVGSAPPRQDHPESETLKDFGDA